MCTPSRQLYSAVAASAALFPELAAILALAPLIRRAHTLGGRASRGCLYGLGGGVGGWRSPPAMRVPPV